MRIRILRFVFVPSIVEEQILRFVFVPAIVEEQILRFAFVPSIVDKQILRLIFVLLRVKTTTEAGKYVFDLRSMTTQERLIDPRHNLADFYYIRIRVLIT